jgi:transcriptional regulator with XRE-family HTH domain
MTLGERICDLRRGRDLTQEQFAKSIGEKRANISSWETDRTTPETKTIKKISEFFSVSIDFLINGGQSSQHNITDQNLHSDMDEFIEFAALFRQLSPRSRRTTILMMKAYLENDREAFKEKIG